MDLSPRRKPSNAPLRADRATLAANRRLRLMVTPPGGVCMPRWGCDVVQHSDHYGIRLAQTVRTLEKLSGREVVKDPIYCRLGDSGQV